MCKFCELSLRIAKASCAAVYILVNVVMDSFQY